MVVYAKLAVRDCAYRFCANVEITGLRMWVRWSTKYPCIPCKPVISQATPSAIANSYHYGLETGHWLADPSLSYVRLIAGGKGQSYAVFKAVQGFTYWGLFSNWWRLQHLYYNRLTIYVSVSANGSFSCAFDRWIKLNVGFVLPTPTCRRIY